MSFREARQRACASDGHLSPVAFSFVSRFPRFPAYSLLFSVCLWTMWKEGEQALMTTPPAQAACKLLVIDIDGTLLTPGGEITEGTRAAIAEAQAAGVTVTLATARRYGNTASI